MHAEDTANQSDLESLAIRHGGWIGQSVREAVSFARWLRACSASGQERGRLAREFEARDAQSSRLRAPHSPLGRNEPMELRHVSPMRSNAPWVGKILIQGGELFVLLELKFPPAASNSWRILSMSAPLTRLQPADTSQGRS